MGPQREPSAGASLTVDGVPQLPQVGAGSVAILRQYGIRSALDIMLWHHSGDLDGIPGIGPARAALLHEWASGQLSPSDTLVSEQVRSDWANARLWHLQGVPILTRALSEARPTMRPLILLHAMNDENLSRAGLQNTPSYNEVVLTRPLALRFLLASSTLRDSLSGLMSDQTALSRICATGYNPDGHALSEALLVSTAQRLLDRKTIVDAADEHRAFALVLSLKDAPLTALTALEALEELPHASRALELQQRFRTLADNALRLTLACELMMLVDSRE